MDQQPGPQPVADDLGGRDVSVPADLVIRVCRRLYAAGDDLWRPMMEGLLKPEDWGHEARTEMDGPGYLVHGAKLWPDGNGDPLWGPMCNKNLQWHVPLVSINQGARLITCPDCLTIQRGRRADDREHDRR